MPVIGPALSAARLADAAFKGIEGAVGVGGGRFGLIEQVAEIEKVLLAGAAFGEVGLLPLGDEILRCSRARAWGWRRR
jgi:hypothetical protein